MRFITLSNCSDCHQSLISNRLNNGDWDYWMVIEVINLQAACGDKRVKYSVSLNAVSPTAAGEANLNKALEQFGFEEIPEYFATDKGKVEALVEYGIKAQLWNENGNNLATLMAKATYKAKGISGLFGFFMDSPQNGIGSTGWDLIAGNVMAGLDRYREA